MANIMCVNSNPNNVKITKDDIELVKGSISHPLYSICSFGGGKNKPLTLIRYTEDINNVIRVINKLGNINFALSIANGSATNPVFPLTSSEIIDDNIKIEDKKLQTKANTIIMPVRKLHIEDDRKILSDTSIVENIYDDAVYALLRKHLKTKDLLIVSLTPEGVRIGEIGSEWRAAEGDGIYTYTENFSNKKTRNVSIGYSNINNAQNNTLDLFHGNDAANNTHKKSAVCPKCSATSFIHIAGGVYECVWCHTVFSMAKTSTVFDNKMHYVETASPNFKLDDVIMLIKEDLKA